MTKKQSQTTNNDDITTEAYNAVLTKYMKKYMERNEHYSDLAEQSNCKIESRELFVELNLHRQEFDKYAQKLFSQFPLGKRSYSFFQIHPILHASRKIKNLDIQMYMTDKNNAVLSYANNTLHQHGFFSTCFHVTHPFLKDNKHIHGIPLLVPYDKTIGPLYLNVAWTYQEDEKKNCHHFIYKITLPPSCHTTKDNVNVVGIKCEASSRLLEKYERVLEISDIKSNTTYNVLPLKGNRTDVSDFKLEEHEGIFKPFYKTLSLPSFKKAEIDTLHIYYQSITISDDFIYQYDTHTLSLS